MFPIEWLLTENIRHLEKVRIDAETRAILMAKFTETVNFELKQRAHMEE